MINRIRGLLSEFGIVLPLKAATVRRQAGACLEELPGWANLAIGDALSELHRLDERIEQYDRHIAQMAREDARAQQLMKPCGVGETTATAIVAMIGNGHEFDCGRQEPAGAHHQSRRQLPAKFAGARCSGRAGCSGQQERPDQPLGQVGGRAARLLARRDRHRGQERTHGLGSAQARRAFEMPT